MATGYTHPVADGKVTDFAEFALDCARAFGALITLRDDPTAEIPAEFQPSPYHSDKAEAAATLLDELRELTPEQISVRTGEANRAAIAYWRQANEARAVKRERYETMLAAVKEWEPPTPDHVRLRDFMVEQLVESIKFDCTGYEQFAPSMKSTAEWHAEQLAAAERDVEYHIAEWGREVERCRERSEWVRALRASLVANEVVG